MNTTRVVITNPITLMLMTTMIKRRRRLKTR
jgi:hypothetical protein